MTGVPQRVGVYGGSFDPPHLGHALLPGYLRALDLVDHVIVAPCVDHPLGKQLSPFLSRWTWTRLAMNPYGNFVEVTTLERDLADAEPGPSTTLRLLEALQPRFPAATLRLVVGSDILTESSRWHRWDRIEREFRPIVVPRAGHSVVGAAMLPEVRSTDIRAWMAAGDWASVRSAVPAAVAHALEFAHVRPAITVIGRGHAGSHASEWLRDRGWDVNEVVGHDVTSGSADVVLDGRTRGVWILVRDDAIEAVALGLVRSRAIASHLPVLHAAGAIPASQGLASLREAGHPVGTLHPICSLRRERRWPPVLGSAMFGVEGDPAARALAGELVGPERWLDLQDLDRRGRARYHAACCLAANHLSVLLEAASTILKRQGHPSDQVDSAMATLLRSALDNVIELGIPAGVTGPAARGDAATVEAHIEALEPEYAALYRTLSARLSSLLNAT